MFRFDVPLKVREVSFAIRVRTYSRGNSLLKAFLGALFPSERLIYETGRFVRSVKFRLFLLKLLFQSLYSGFAVMLRMSIRTIEGPPRVCQ